MSETSTGTMPPSAPEFARKAAIVGVGETDYQLDYQAERARAPGWEAPTVEELSTRAFERALADSGLAREDIDGISVSYTYGGPDPEEMARLIGVAPRYAIRNGNIMAGPLPVVCADIAAGKADTVAMIFAVASRSAGRQFGGATHATGQGGPSSYWYYHPWGWSSQAAHWALMFARYQAEYGATEADLGEVALQIRRHAAATPNAVMKKPVSIEDYLASRYIVRPLHLLDICIVNDGAVCLIVRRTDRARDLPKVPVSVAGWGHGKIKGEKMHAMVRERLIPTMQGAAAQALAMAGVSLGDVRHFEAYDASSIHLVNQVEGYGFVAPGQGLAFCRDGQMTVGGAIPTNTAGGNLSGSYMQGWSQVVESVRQLRGESGVQVPNAEVSLSTLTQTDQTHPIVYVRGA